MAEVKDWYFPSNLAAVSCIQSVLLTCMRVVQDLAVAACARGSPVNVLAKQRAR